jgi:aspartate/methionine/tyrosine aminotransferase
LLKCKNLITWTRPKAGTVAYPRIHLPPEINIDEFCRTLAERHGVLLLPGSVYKDCEDCQGSKELDNENCARIRIGFGRRAFEKGLFALKTALESELPGWV